MRDPANIFVLAETQPDFMGFIFYEKSPRYVGEQFKVPAISDQIERVGVFVSQPIEFILEATKENELTLIQLHGDESPVFCEAIKSFGLKVMKAFRIGDDFDWTLTKHYESCVDYFLFDTKGKTYGGTGVAFNWQLLDNYSGSVPFFLSGGISEENISNISMIEHPMFFGIDLNSGVEDSPGKKSKSKVESILKIVKEQV